MLIRGWDFWLTVVPLAFQLGLLAIIVGRRLLAAWGSIAFCLFVDASANVALLWLSREPHHYKAYYWTYWAAAAILNLARIWIAVDVARSFKFVEYLPRWSYWGAVAFAAVVAVGTVAPNWHGSVLNFHLAQAMLELNSYTEDAWGVFFIVLLVAIRISGVQWSRMGLTIACGFFAKICVGIQVSRMLAQHTPRTTLQAGMLQSGAELLILSFWAYVFLSARKPLSPSKAR